MTRPEAAHAKIVSSAHLPVRVLLELRRIIATCRSSSTHNVHEEDHNAADPSKTPTTTVRGTAGRSHPLRLPLDVQQQLRHALVQWMQALAKMIRKEDDDEQDYR
jgi:hypothetical protein